MKISRSFKHLLYFNILYFLSSVFCYAQENEQISPEFRLHYPNIINNIYQENEGTLFWGNIRLRETLEKQLLVLAIANIDEHFVQSYQSLRKAAEHNQTITYDRLASDLFLYYLSYSEQKEIQGKDLLFADHANFSLPPPSEALINAFFNAESDNNKWVYLKSVTRKSEHYNRLYTHLLDYYASIDPYLTIQPYTASVKPGNKIADKQLLLTHLLLSGEISAQQKDYFETEDNTTYSDEFEYIIKRFQHRHGLKTDGIIGKNTRYWLNTPPQERLRLIALNILRSELWDRNNANAVFVNIPDFTMEYWEMGEKQFESKVIVGRFKRKTPIFSTKLDSIVFNPTWSVPSKIMRRDILPNALNDVTYFEKYQYEIIPNWRSDEVIDINDINWESLTVNNFPYKLRQRSGPINALGKYKFNTPNKRAIFLHDTPAKYLFTEQRRSFSSGCIRIEKAQEFAHLLVLKSGFPEETYLTRDEQQKTSVLGLKKVISFSTIYQTVWLNDDDIMQFRKDIYNYDQPKEPQNVKNEEIANGNI